MPDASRTVGELPRTDPDVRIPGEQPDEAMRIVICQCFREAENDRMNNLEIGRTGTIPLPV